MTNRPPCATLGPVHHPADLTPDPELQALAHRLAAIHAELDTTSPTTQSWSQATTSCITFTVHVAADSNLVLLPPLVPPPHWRTYAWAPELPPAPVAHQTGPGPRWREYQRRP